jgi:hypothetical protein
MPAEIPDGAVIVARAILNSSLWTMRPQDCKVAITCIALCNWTPRKWWDGKQEITIERGQFVRSWNGLAKASCLTKKQIRTSVLHLQNTGFLARKSAGRYSIFTLPKYLHYQDLTKYSDSVILKTGTTSGRTRARRGHDAGTKQEDYEGNEFKKGGEEPPRATPAHDPGEGPVPGDELIATLKAFASWEVPGEEAKKKAIRDLVRQGVSHQKIRAAAKQNPSSDFFAVYDRLKNGKADHPFIPSSPTTPRAIVNPKEHDEKKAQLADIDDRLKNLSPDDLDRWTKEAHERASGQKIYGPAIKIFITAELRRRMAAEVGIKGV